MWGSSHLGVGPQRVEELLRCLVTLVCTALPEARRDLIEGPAFGLGNFEVSEDEEEHQENREDDEDIGTTELLENRHTITTCPG